MRALRNQIHDFFLLPSGGEILSLLRIVVGGMMFLKALWLYPHIDELYGLYGYLQARLMESIMGGNVASWALHQGISPKSYSFYLHLFFAIHIASAFSFMLGYKTRIANITLWATQTFLFHIAWVSAYGIDAYCQNVTFFMIWMPVARFWSIDARLSRVPVEVKDAWATASLRAVQFYILMTYIDAGFSKAMGTDWWSGAAIWSVLHLPEFNHFDFYWMAEVPWLPKIAALGTVFFESFYIVGVWIPRAGRYWAMAIISMHIGIATIIGLTLFGITLALINAVLFLTTPDFIERLKRRRPARECAV